MSPAARGHDGRRFVRRNLFRSTRARTQQLAGAAIVILAVDTQQLFTSGFQLSFAVVGAILIGRGGFFAPCCGRAHPDPFLPRSLVRRSRRVVERRLSTIGRWAGCFPPQPGSDRCSDRRLVLFPIHAHLSPRQSRPLCRSRSACWRSGLMSLVVSPLSPALSLVFNHANWSLSNLIFRFVQVFARLPTGHFYVERPHWPTGAQTEITVLDAGAGAAVHLRRGSADWLFDTG